MKTLKTFLFGLFVCLAMVNLTACGDDDDPKPEPQPEKPVEVKFANYHFNCTSDMLVICDIEATYKDKEGKAVTEKITNKEWAKKLDNLKTPFTAELKITAKKKADFKADKDVYVVGLNADIDTNGQIFNKYTNIPIGKDKIDKYLEEFGEIVRTVEIK